MMADPREEVLTAETVGLDHGEPGESTSNEDLEVGSDQEDFVQGSRCTPSGNEVDLKPYYGTVYLQHQPPTIEAAKVALADIRHILNPPQNKGNRHKHAN